MNKTIFFAYQSAHKSGSPDSVDAIKAAISTLNSESNYTAISWEQLSNNGRIVNKSIMEAIDNSDFFACDLTYLNHNVLFELGYAIGKKRKLFILLNAKEERAILNYDALEILKNVGYSCFDNSNQIVQAILKEQENKPILIEDLVNFNNINANSHDIFYIRNVSFSQAEMEAYEYVNNSEYQIICDDSSEVEYRPLQWYIESVIKTRSMVVHITGSSKIGAFQSNAKASLYAGLGCGFGKQLLLLAPSPYSAPIDYEDILLQYQDSKQCVEKMEKWLQAHIDKNRDREINNDDREMSLLKLGLGCDVAEQEKDQLASYFVETKSFHDAISSSYRFFVGRKGTGKTAIYLMLDRELSSDNKTYVISLKPESSEFLNNIEVAELYTSAASKQSFFFAIWKAVIYSRLLCQVEEKIAISKKVEFSELEKQIIDFVRSFDNLIGKHFLETINYVYADICKNPKENVLNKLYELFINPMMRLIKRYFENTKYYRIAILADNLDVTWDIKNDLSLQAEMLFSLFEVAREIQNELKNKLGTIVDTKAILFLRKDIFNYLLNYAQEPDKLILSKYEIDWASFPGLLQTVIEKRFKHVLNLKTENEVLKIWQDYFAISLTGKQTVFQRINSACLQRPRDLLVFIGHMFESAFNNSHKRVTESDFKYAVNEYSKFLYQNLIAEMSSEFPNIREVLISLQKRFIDRMEYISFYNEINELLKDPEKASQMINSLFKNGYLYAVNENTGEKYDDHESAYAVAKNAFKKILWFRIKLLKTQVYVQLQRKYNTKV